MAEIDGSADPREPAPPTPAPGASSAAPEGPEAPDGAKGAKASKGLNGPKVTRRAALGVLGGGVVAGAGYFTTKRVLWAEEETASKRVEPAAPSTGSTAAPTTTSTEPPTTAPEGDFALWSDPATWGGKVPGAGDLSTSTPRWPACWSSRPGS